MKSKTPLKDLSFQFALNILEFSELLNANRKFTISKQISRSGTSIGANVREAQSAESRADFVHKLKISAKEAEETMYWLELCQQSENYPSNPNLINDLKVIQKLLGKIISTTKRNMN